MDYVLRRLDKIMQLVCLLFQNGAVTHHAQEQVKLGKDQCNGK